VLKGIERTKGRVKIAKIKKVKGGLDLYLSDNKYLIALGKKLRERFPGIVKVSRRLHTTERMSGKLLYRVTVLFRSTKYGPGDEIEYQGERYKILRITDKAHLKSLESGKRKSISLEALLRLD
ncbi:hypothetical protein D6825_00135, partial [Candidatus Woesearchaeota archaeon]